MSVFVSSKHSRRSLHEKSSKLGKDPPFESPPEPGPHSLGEDLIDTCAIDGASGCDLPADFTDHRLAWIQASGLP